MKKKSTLLKKPHWNSTDMAELICHETGVSATTAKVVIDKMGEMICAHLTESRDNCAHISGFGTFYIRCWKGRNLKIDGKLYRAVDHPRIAFRAQKNTHATVSSTGVWDYDKKSKRIEGNGEEK